MPIPEKTRREAVTSAKERVYAKLLAWIISGMLQPGEKLNEAELADYFAVSRTPVREALMLLAAEGFTEIIPNRGSFVSCLSMHDADAVYTAITAIQGDIARLASKRAAAPDLTRLEQLNGEYARAAEAGDIARVLDADERFHGEIAALAANPYLLQFLQRLQYHVYRFEYILSRENAVDHLLSVRNHRDLIDAIAARDPEAADRASTANWMGQYETQRDLLAQMIRANGWEKA